MAKKQNSSKELTLEQILWNCRDILRNKIEKSGKEAYAIKG